MASTANPTQTSAADTNFTFKWSKEHTAQFIQLRGETDHLFTGAKHTASFAWRTILQTMGLDGSVSPMKAKKKWDNLKKKCKDCKCPGSGEGVSGKPTAATWPWFVLMDEVLGQKHSTSPPVLIASIPEDTLGPGVGDQEEERSGRERSQTGGKRKRESDNHKELMDLFKEDIKYQRETQEGAGDQGSGGSDVFLA